MELIYQYIRDRQLFTREDFCARLAVPVLLFKRSKASLSDDIRMRTMTQAQDTFDYDAVLSEANRVIRTEAHQYRIFRLVQNQPNLPRTVQVGRARTNDLVINDTSVSKVHAQFEIVRNDEIYVLDLKSKNGTRIDSTTVTPEQKVRLKSGDTVHLGGLAMMFLSPEAFFDVLADMTVPK